MKVLVFWKYYQRYLDFFYKHHFDILDPLNYRKTKDRLLQDHFGWAGDLYLLMIKKSIDCEYFVINDYTTQTKWAKENNYIYDENNWELDIAIHQIKKYNPEIIFTDIGVVDTYQIKFREFVKKVVVWVGAKPGGAINTDDLNVLITDQEDTLASQHKDFEKVIVTYPGFNKSILDQIGPTDKKNDIVFIGSLTYQHLNRINILYDLLKKDFPLELYGFMSFPTIKSMQNKKLLSLFSLSGMKKIYNYTTGRLEGVNKKLKYIADRIKAPIFGMEYYKMIAETKIIVNIHIDSSGEHSGNMRMFEATGLGSCLLTDKKERNAQFFDTNTDIVEYQNIEELTYKVDALLNNHVKLDRIAKNGQNKTASYHTIERMFSDIIKAF